MMSPKIQSIVLFLGAAVAAACTDRNPTYDSPNYADGSAGCPASQPLRCDGANLVRCNQDGTAEVNESCPFACNATDLRCAELTPSNGLAKYIHPASNQSDLNLGNSATINTDNGDVTVDGALVGVASDLIVQADAPNIRVLIVRSLTTKDVVVTGRNALAVISNGDIQINGAFAASARNGTPGAGAFNEDLCKGKVPLSNAQNQILGGLGGGGFGTAGGPGGRGISAGAAGAAGGAPTGNASLIPLRGGCDGGNFGGYPSAGGGAIQFFSATQIAITGFIAANGSSGYAGGGSGGGILLEAPKVEVIGGVIANGGGGGGAKRGEDGRLDAIPAFGGAPYTDGHSQTVLIGTGGSGGAGNIDAAAGGAGASSGGHGGGGVGRIRINTAAGGLHVTGVISPNPSEGPLNSN